MRKKKISLLGSTGSIGLSTLKVCRHLQDSIEVCALAAKQNIDQLEKQAIEFQPDLIAVYDKDKALELQRRLPNFSVTAGMEGLCEAASLAHADMVVSAMVGSVGILPTIKAVEAGKDVALANKEVLVSAGRHMMDLVKEKGVSMIPVDSEHSAIFQCLQGEDIEAVSRLILTASGGPFRNFTKEQLQKVTRDQALKHPTWQMGPKNTIDSSTLMNKGLELIEAYFLFGLPIEKMDIIVHPQSLVHSFVEFQDGNLLAQISEPSMLLPIQYALTYPTRQKSPARDFSFDQFSKFEFYPVDKEKFKCITLAYQALRIGGSMPCFMNAANEVLVERFLRGEIAWLSISEKLEKLMGSFKPSKEDSIEEILEVDGLARAEARGI
ncbi:MAG: 1-deoxy-D-xylulose-5-phosphate reductoisomerase [Simkaniaceae bacterium]